MSGVRFLSIILAIVATFLWGGFVVDTWYKNSAQRIASQDQINQKQKSQEDKTLEHADALAVAASEEFNKITDSVEQEPKADHSPDSKNIAGVTKEDQSADKKQPSAWMVPDGASPKYDVKKLAATRAKQQKIAEKEKAQAALKKPKKKAEQKLAKGQSPWKVPDGATPAYEGRAPDMVAIAKPAWTVPEGATPKYSTKKIASVRAKHEKLLAKQQAQAVKKLKQKQAKQKLAKVTSGWKVPDAATPAYEGRAPDIVAIAKPEWSVPEGATPKYNVKKIASVRAEHEKKLAKEKAQATKKIAKRLSENKLAKDTSAWSVPIGVTPDYKGRAPDKVVVTAKSVKTGAKPIWTVPDGASPEYDEDKAFKVGAIPWRVPTGNDPISLGFVGSKISKLADNVKEGTQEAAEKVSEKLSTLANDVKETVAAQDKWRVPTGVEPEYEGRDVIADADTPVWRVPDAVSPSYESKVEVADTKKQKGDKEQVSAQGETAQNHIVVTEEEVVVGKIETRLQDEEGNNGFKKDTARLSKDLKAVPVAKYADPKDQPNKKSDRLNVAVFEEDSKRDETSKQAEDKNQEPNKKSDEQVKKEPVVANVKEPSETKKPKEPKKIAKAKPVWTVPTGNDPDYSVVAQLERGIDSVKEMAVEAGTEIASKVESIGSNVKEAVAAPKKWEVPTGVTWQDDEPVIAEKKEAPKAQAKQVAVLDVKNDKSDTKSATKEMADEKKEPVKSTKSAVKSEPQPKVKKEAVEGKEESKPVNEKGKEQKSSPEAKIADVKQVPEKVKEVVNVPLPERKEIVVAALPEKKPEPAIVPKKVIEKEPELFVSSQLKPVGEEMVVAAKKGKQAVQEKAEKKEDQKKTGVVKRILDFISDVKKGDDERGEKRKTKVSMLDAARFEAIKNLMVDEVNYEFTDVKEGKGKIEISGRSQVGAKLALYVGPRYLGDVEPDNAGEWIFKKDMYLPQGKHVVHAQQMSKSGLVLARKTKPLLQKTAAKAPKDYDPGVGIALGDAALKEMQKKLGDEPAQKGKKSKRPKVVLGDAGVNQQFAALDPAQLSQTGKLPNQTHYVVRPGDTLSKISQKVYGNAKYYKRILQLNPKLKGKSVIRPKQKLVVRAIEKPKDEEQVQVAALDKKEPVVKEKTKDKVEKVVEKVEQKEVKTRKYVVKPGDNLGKIAQKVYGDARLFKKIMELNPKLKKANLIYPKQVLIVGGQVAAKKEKAPEEKKVKIASLDKKTEVKAKDDAAKGQEFYKVKQGDNLWIIAKKVFGNGARYKEIIKLNPKLAKNPKLIKPNVQLRVRKS